MLLYYNASNQLILEGGGMGGGIMKKIIGASVLAGILFGGFSDENRTNVLI